MKGMKKAVILSMLVTIIVSLGVLVACKNTQQSRVDNIGAYGLIDEMYINEDGIVTGLLVKSDMEGIDPRVSAKYEYVYDIAALEVDLNETKVLRNGEEILPENLKKGMHVDVELVGEIEESYPIQATAGVITVLESVEIDKYMVDGAYGKIDEITMGSNGKVEEILVINHKKNIKSEVVEKYNYVHEAAYVEIDTENTRVIQDGDNKSIEDLEIGMIVEVKLIGAIKESYPIQAVGGLITIIE